MRTSIYHFFPLALPLLLVFLFVLGLVIALVEIGVLLTKNRMFGRALVAIVIVAIAVHSLAYPVRGVGIAVPWLVPPLVAAGAALLLSRRSAPSLAYIAGSLGTLIGADLLNLGKVAGLGAPIASIGGAGTFDGIFLAGILAVLLA